MGCFTFTFAGTNKSMKYYKQVYLALPDGTFLKEPSYDGYGIIAGKDVYGLVVDWNKDTPEAIEIIKDTIKELKAELKTSDYENRISYIKSEIPRLEKFVNFLKNGIPSISEEEYRYLGI